MKLKLLILVLALQSAWLLGTVAVQEHALASGKVILLETRPVDPRDLLRGDYLMLNYKISDVPAKLFSPPVKNDLPYGTKFSSRSRRRTNRFYEVTRASTNRFAPAANEILLRGESGIAGGTRPIPSMSHTASNNYYVAEGTGNPTGRLPRRPSSPSPASRKSRKLFVDGKPYAQAMKSE